MIVWYLLPQVVGGVGDGLKQTATTFSSAVNGTHVTEMQNSGAAIAQHGKNALNALKDAVTDILSK